MIELSGREEPSQLLPASHKDQVRRAGERACGRAGGRAVGHAIGHAIGR